MLEQMRRGKVFLPPLSFRFLEYEPVRADNLRVDAFIEASWRKVKARFAVECKSLSTPKAFQAGLDRLKSLSLPRGCQPLLLMPFLSESQLEDLEREGISGVDLCGNGVVMGPGLFAIFRSGKPNRFSSSAPIKNIYRRNTSMVGRVFLARSGFGSVQEICREINSRNPLVNLGRKKNMSLSTVSKSLQTLEEDLIIERGDGIRLLQPDKLLEKLGENYAPPKIKDRVRLKVLEDEGAIGELLGSKSRELKLPLAVTGLSSVARYAVMQRGDMLSVYCPFLEKLLEQLPGSRSDRFSNLELVETDDETVYFDARADGCFGWASPVQVYLELMTGDKRDRETAEQVKSFLLQELQGNKP